MEENAEVFLVEERESTTGETRERPCLTSITSDDRRTEEEKRKGAILFRNIGLMAINLNTAEFNKLLRANGLTPEQINSLVVEFRAGMLADRSYHGDLIGGFGLGKKIEIYTSLPATQDRVYTNHIPIHARGLIDFLLHELRHYIQVETGMGDAESFTQTPEEVRTNPLEIDACQFAKNHLEQGLGWLELRENPGLRFEDNTGEGRVIGRLANYGHFYNLDRRIHLVDPDNPVVYLETKIKNILSGEVSPSRQNLDTFIAKARVLVAERKLGVAEYNWILDRLATHFEDDNREFSQLVLESKYQPEDV